MRLVLAGVLILLLGPGPAAANPDRADRLRRLDRAARAFTKAIQNMVVSCTKCAGQGRLRRERKTWTCPKCKGTGNQVVRLWHAKIHWSLRSQAYRESAGSRIDVLRRHREEMKRRARPLTAGTFKHVEMIDEQHGISWHTDTKGAWSHFRWIHEAEEGWAWFHPNYDGPWPESNADFGYPGATADDFIETRHDTSKNRGSVSTRTLEVGGQLTLRLLFEYTGKSHTMPPRTVRVEVRSNTKALGHTKRQDIVIFADGTRMEVASPRVVGGEDSSHQVVTGELARARFIRMANASRVEVQVGLAHSFSLTTVQRRILQALAHRASTPARTK